MATQQTHLAKPDIKALNQEFRSALRPLPDRPHWLASDEISEDAREELGSDEEVRFARLWVELYPEIDLYTQYKFHPKRRFKLDFFEPRSKTGIEVNGGTFSQMGHSTGTGISRDYEKVRLAAECGIQVVSIPAHQVEEADLHHEIARVIRSRLQT